MQDLIGIDSADFVAAFDGCAKICAFSGSVDEIAGNVKGADALAIWVYGRGDTKMSECTNIVEKISSQANNNVNAVWAAGLGEKKPIIAVAGWKPKGSISKETLKSAVDAKVKELGTKNFDVKKWAEETKATFVKLSKDEGEKPEVCKECGREKDDIFDELLSKLEPGNEKNKAV